MTRKRQLQSTAVGKATKRQKQESFLQLTSDPTSLAIFLKKIEEDEEDIVKEYLSECNGDDLLALLETGFDRKAYELAVILKVIAIVIVRTRTDLAESHADTGRRLAEGVLEDAPLNACFRALKPQSSAEAAKASLQLLSGVVATDPVLLGRSLLRSIQFDHSDWVQLCRRRNTKDANDVRTCFVNFIASFLMSDNNLLIRELLESKNVIMLLISECFTDKLSNVLLILALLRSKVCENPTVSKTIKMRLFTRAALRQLAYLYAYRGEALSVKAALAKSSSEIDTQSVEMVREAVHNLLHPLTSSPLRGIVFRERTSVEGSKQNDHLLSLLLSPPMDNAHTDTLRCELVRDCLLASPALLAPYLAHWAPSMEPRDSDNWFGLIKFVNELLQLFQKRLVSRASQLLELSQDMSQFVTAICDICLPPPSIAEYLRLAAQHEAPSVVEMADELHRTLRHSLAVLLVWLNTTDDLQSKGATAGAITEAIVKLLPERVLVDKWFQRFSKTLAKANADLSLLEGQEAVIRQTEDDVQEEVPVDGDTATKLPPSLEEELACLPKKLRRRLSTLQGLSCNPSAEIPDKELKKLTSEWSKLIEDCLENHWHNAAVLNCLAAGVRFFEKNDEALKKEEHAIALKRIIKILSQNPNFRAILLEKTTEFTDERATTHLKCGLLNLFLALGEVNPSFTAKGVPLIAFLTAYRGSLSFCDQQILQLLYLLDLSGHSISQIWGMPSAACVVWGDRVSDHYRFGATLGDVPTLWREPQIGAFLGLLDKDRLLKTALNFPVTRRCLARSTPALDSRCYDELYDPCFLLPLFLNYLTPAEASGSTVDAGKIDLHGFYARNCLSFAIGALSSYSRHLRGLAKAVIARYRQLSAAWRPTKMANTPMGLAVMKQFPERIQLNFFLDTLRNSLSNKASELGGGPRRHFLFASKADTSFRLTRLHANFFIHSIGMLTKPDHRMYEVFCNTYLAKPAIDLGTVPDFFRIIFSVHEDFRVERQWMFKLCADSVNDTSDYLLLEKSRVYKYCLLLYADPATDTTTQIQILRLLTATTRIPRACHALTRFHALPLWLFRHALSTTHAPFLCYFLTIISQMLSAFEEVKESSPGLPMLRLLDTQFREHHDESSFAKRKIKLVLP